jgi:hypothetical protein
LRGLPAVWLLASALAASCSADDTGGNPPAGGAGGSSGGTSATGGSGANGGSSGSGGASTGGSAGSTSGGSGGSGGTSGTGGSGSGGGGSSGGAGGAKDGGAGAGGTTGTSGSGGSAGGTAGTGGRSGADAGDASIRDGAAGANANDAGARDGDAATSCVKAKLLWSEDFETGDYSRWTSQTYDGNWGNDCQSNGFSTVHALSGTHSHRSEIVCAYTESHRGYGGLQFAGDAVVSKYTNTGVGTDAPYGVINTFHSWLDTPTVFQNGKWFSPWTVNDDCGWADEVMTLGLEDPTNKLAAAHYQAGGGTRVFAPNAPAFPTGRWVRVTVYVNYYDGTMHYWQDGAEVAHVTFVRPKKTICQWHWGMYASADNDNIVLFEDDNSIWKLDEAWTDFKKEPWLGGSVQVCP